MDLIRQIGAGDVLHRPVASPHLVRKIGPAPRHQIPAREPQPTRPACAVAGVPLAPVPGQLAERRVAVHQVRARGGDTLCQTLHELHVRGGHKLEVRHGAPLCQVSATPSNRSPGPPIAAVNSTTREAHCRGGGADGRSAAMSLDYAGDCGNRPTRVTTYRAILACYGTSQLRAGAPSPATDRRASVRDQQQGRSER